MPRFNIGDKVCLNEKYMDARSHVGEVFTVTNVATIGEKECVFVKPSLGGAYAADGFALIERGA